MTPPNRQKTLAECADVESKATAGPWVYHQWKPKRGRKLRRTLGTRDILAQIGPPFRSCDMKYISTARTVLPVLLRYVRELQSMIEWQSEITDEELDDAWRRAWAKEGE